MICAAAGRSMALAGSAAKAKPKPTVVLSSNHLFIMFLLAWFGKL
jgi:hypothetical protein